MARFLPFILALTVVRGGAFEDRFTGQTLRLDYYHTGTATRESCSLDGLRGEGAWPGSRTQLVDGLGLGKYRFAVTDPQTGEVLYSRGFASIYGEWETIAEARQEQPRGFHESLRFPEPRRPVRVVLEKRHPEGVFRTLAAWEVDPGGRAVNRAAVSSAGRPWTVFKHGPPATKVDILVLGDGYQRSQRGRFRKDVQRLVGELFALEPFRSRKPDFNVRALDLDSQDSGISDPRAGHWKNTALGLSFNSFDSDRYVLTYANRTVRELAAALPYDVLIIIFNDRKYGGGGIYNLYATVSAHTSAAAYVFVHEFGHAFAGLGDEYYSSSVAYEEFNPPGTEPWEANITALLNPAELKWQDLTDPATPLPTPWNQVRYDSLTAGYQQQRRRLLEQAAPAGALELLFRQVKQATVPVLKANRWFGTTGAFEGAGYQSRGLYRPEIDCLMFSRNPRHFCRVCRRAIEQVIDTYTR